MSRVIGISNFASEIRDALRAKEPVRLVGSTAAFGQIGLASFIEAELEQGCRKLNVAIIAPQQKALGAWMGFAEYSLPALRREGLLVEANALPHFAGWGNDRFVNPTLNRRQRLSSLSALTKPHGVQVVLTTAMGLFQRTMTPAAMQDATIKLRLGQQMDQDDLISRLQDLSYRSTRQVDEEGAFALRGGILDIFPPNGEVPVRIEFVGDEVASMRAFSIANQRSTHALESVAIGPTLEAILSSKERSSQAQRLFARLLELKANVEDRDGINAAFLSGQYFQGLDGLLPTLRPESCAGFDYVNDEQSVLVIPGSIDAAVAAYEEFYAQTEEAAQRDLAQGRAVLPISDHFMAPDDVRRRLSEFDRIIELENPFSDERRRFLTLRGRVSVEGAPHGDGHSASEMFDKWVDIIRRYTAEGRGVVLLAHHEEQLERISSLLEHRGISFQLKQNTFRRLVSLKMRAGHIALGIGDLPSPVWLEDLQILVIPETSLFGAPRKRVISAPAKLQNYLSSFKDLNVGDLVVHIQHGIGRYLGMKELAVAGQLGHFLLLEYAGADKVYLPVDKLNLLQRYNSGEGHAPALDKLKGQGWTQRKAKVGKAIRDMAEELVKLQAKRELAGGHAFSPLSDEYFAFEAEFPYEETEDQLRSIQDIMADMSHARPMDRLVCGDVGFGKTEVALRGAFRAVLDHYQVMVLVPTTVLCYQHYRTFRDRMQHHGVQVAQVNRFVSTADAKEALEGFASGRIDVLVGTHRMLSKDVKPKRLGLLIVDEEQKFGVAHKERLKQFRADCDVLTLTATPIPRTLHMAMVGLRDISIIATAPTNRVSVKTFVTRFEESLIKDAVEYEVKRGGQVFFVHNRVEDIAEVANFVKALVPQASMRYAHGQMPEHQLEQTIVDFIEQKFHVLVCTTIIEAGVDMPNVNTLIVNRADRFGLSQLYQLRGRVGRSDRQAFAYFLTPPQETLTADAQKRLDVLSAHQELGAGFQIASHDLEIRGAGNLLGGEQSGHVADIGIELYTEMLEAAINEARGGDGFQERVDVELKMPISAVIPAEYISEEGQRLQTYKALFSAESAAELKELKSDLEDRFGIIPSPVKLLLRIGELKRMLRACHAVQFAAKGGRNAEIRFGSLREKQIDKILKVAMKRPDRYKLSPDYRLTLNIGSSLHPEPNFESADTWLMDVCALITPLAEEMAAN